MIYVTGDCHQDFSKFSMKNFPDQKSLTKDDFVIICGDFGGIFSTDATLRSENHILDELDARSFTTLFVDGNHENFDRLNSYPIEEWNGGNIHKIRDSVIHLMRGQVFNIDGYTFFTFGGARSHDISGGILELGDPLYHEKKKQLDRDWEPYRINHLSWWKEELPTQEEMDEGIKNLESVNYTVDFVISHCAPSSVQDLLENERHRLFKHDVLTDYLETIRQKLSYKKWYFGHYHDNKNLTEKDNLLYKQIIKLGDNVPASTLGSPRYLIGDLVKFNIDDETIEGRISIIDAYGTYEQQDEPSYDILVRGKDGTKCLYKHVRESIISF